MTVVNWYPGHMAKARKGLKEQVSLADLVLETGDARLPIASRNPELHDILGRKPSLLVLNKADLIEKSTAKVWLDWYESRGEKSVFIAATQKSGMKELKDLLAQETARLNQEMVSRGRRPRPIRLIVAGIPNTGKSAVLNALVGSNKVKTGDRPGLTRALQWVRCDENWEILDSPGILWPTLEDQEAAMKLAVVGSISKDAYSEEESGWYLLNWLKENEPKAFERRFQITELPRHSEELLLEIGRKRGLLQAGGRIRERDAYILLLKEFRSGALGKICLEKPPTEE